MSSDTPVSLHDPAFELTRTRKLHVAGRCDNMDARRFLSVEVARDALNLQAHVRRILLLIDEDQRDLLPGALIDIFIALGKHGESLRYALLEVAEPFLEEEDLHFLRGHLNTGISPDENLQMVEGSVFSHALDGTAEMIGRERQQQQQAMGAVAEANALLEEGDLDGARNILEDALLAHPEDTAISNELLLIYRHSRDEAAFTAMREKLMQKIASLPAPWDQPALALHS